MFQRTYTNNRQDRNWLTSAQVERRSDIRQESQMPPDPLPSRFSDWSSLGSPHTRTSPHSAPDIAVEQNENIPNQLSVQSEVEPRHETVRMSTPQVDQPVEDQNVPAIGIEQTPLNIEVGMQRDDTEVNEEINVLTTQASGSVMPPLGVDELVHDQNIQQASGDGSDTSRGSHVRTQDTNVQAISSIIPMERLTLRRDRMIVSEPINIAQCHLHERTHSQRTSTSTRRDYLDDSSDDNRLLRG